MRLMAQILLVMAFSQLSLAGSKGKVFVKDGFVAGGYDVVSYLDGNKAVEGDSNYLFEFEGAKYKFASQENLEKFRKDSKKYIPAYGGYCAWAMAEDGSVVTSDPKKFILTTDDKGQKRVLLFYNGWLANTKKLWEKKVKLGSKEEKAFIKKADQAWSKKHKS